MKKYFFAIFIFYSFFLYAESNVSVFCYHAFNNRKNKYCISLKTLEREIKVFKKAGFHFITFSDLKSGRLKYNKNILISVDDGNKTVLIAYKKIFKKYGIMPLLAIYPSVIGRKKYALTWKQLRYLKKQGCTIAAHGYYHLSITDKLFRQNKAYFFQEIYRSKKILESKLGNKIEVFVYPYGAYSDITIRTLKKAGYKYALTVSNGNISLPLSLYQNKKRFSLPRYMVEKGNFNYFYRKIVDSSKKNKKIFISKLKIKNRKKNLYIKNKYKKKVVFWKQYAYINNINDIKNREHLVKIKSFSLNKLPSKLNIYNDDKYLFIKKKNRNEQSFSLHKKTDNFLIKMKSFYNRLNLQILYINKLFFKNLKSNFMKRGRK